MNSGVQLRAQFILALFHCPSLPPRTPSADQRFSILYLKQLQLFAAVDEDASYLVQITSSNLVLPSADGLTTDSVMESGVPAVYTLLIMVCAYPCKWSIFRGNFSKYSRRQDTFWSYHATPVHARLPFFLRRRWAVIIYSSFTTDGMDYPSDIAPSCWKKTA